MFNYILMLHVFFIIIIYIFSLVIINVFFNRIFY